MKKPCHGARHLCCFHVFFFCSLSIAQKKSTQVPDIPSLTVEGNSSLSNTNEPFVLQQDILYKSSKNVAEALSEELGISNTSFGQNANRPVIRGLSGARAPMMQNGMNPGDVSNVSDDHAVAGDVLFNQSIEVLRGGEALRYSSGAIQGLVNIVDSRIPTSILSASTASLVTQYNFNQQGLTGGIFAEDTIGKWTLHLDNTSRKMNDYQRPDGQSQAYSFSRQNDFGLGASYFRESGYTGISFSQFQNFYGVPSQEGAQIDLLQKRLALRDELYRPWGGITKLVTQLAYTNYYHQEISIAQTPEAEFKNKLFDLRLEFFHEPIFGWQGSFGIQANNSSISATDLTNPITNAAIIPATKSDQLAVFSVQNKSFGSVDLQNALRFEGVRRNPNTSVPYTDNPNFSIPSGAYLPMSIAPVSTQFSLMSLSTQAAWNFTFDQAFLVRYTFSQRAPNVEELYSYGNHEATATFNVGNPTLNKEGSNHFELGYRKNKGLIQGKLNLYQSYVNHYIYSQYTGAVDLDSNFPVRQYLQSNAILKGVESKITYNLNGDGFSSWIYGDYSEGNLNQGGYLPLQPATRIGGSLNFSRFGWKSQLSVIHALGHNKTASSAFYNEPRTDGYNKVDFRLSKSQAFNKLLLTYYLQANNLLNDTIRFSTTVETIRANAPQPGRSLMIGLKLDY